MNVNDVIAARIEQARRKVQSDRKRRAQLAAARQRGIAQRHAAKLRNLRAREGNAAVGQQPTTVGHSPKVQLDRGDTPTAVGCTKTPATDGGPAGPSVRDSLSLSNGAGQPPAVVTETATAADNPVKQYGCTPLTRH